MKVDFLVTKNVLKGGGIEHYTREVGRRLVQRGYDVTVYSTGDKPGSPRSYEGMKIKWLPVTKPHWTEKVSGALMATAAEVLSDSPDVVHLHSVVAGAMAAILKMCKIPSVVQMHGIEWQRNRWSRTGQTVLRRLEQASFHHGTVFTAVSRTQCEFYKRQYGMPVTFIPTAAEIKRFREAHLIRGMSLKPRKYVLSASRLVPEKGIHYLLEAFKRVNSDWQLVLAGDHGGEIEYYRALKRLADKDPRVHFLGHVSGPLLEELFSNAGLYVQPSEIEGLAIALLEAMSYGVECLVSDIPENLEALGEAGQTFRNKDVDDLVRHLQFIIGGEASPKFGELARQRVEKFYNWELVTDSLECLYRNAVAVSNSNERHLARVVSDH